MAAPAARNELVELLRRTSERDRQAFADLHARTSAKLFGIICRILPNHELAEEALQDCFLNIWRTAGRYDPEIASPISWMAAIARNCAIDIRRLSAERISQGSEELVDELTSNMAGPLASAERTELLRKLLGCLNELPEDGKHMVLLAYFQGWSRKEIGERYNRPVNTVKTLLRRNLALLKGCLDGS
jgi:RNA polymerase sigma-70 factor (ECF subfamily)